MTSAEGAEAQAAGKEVQQARGWVHRSHRGLEGIVGDPKRQIGTALWFAQCSDVVFERATPLVVALRMEQGWRHTGDSTRDRETGSEPERILKVESKRFPETQDMGSDRNK